MSIDYFYFSNFNKNHERNTMFSKDIFELLCRSINKIQ